MTVSVLSPPPHGYDLQRQKLHLAFYMVCLWFWNLKLMSDVFVVLETLTSAMLSQLVAMRVLSHERCSGGWSLYFYVITSCGILLTVEH